QQERDKLLQVDREWSKTTKDVEKFVSFIAPDGSVYPQGMPVVTGTAAVRKTFTGLSSAPGFALQWSPAKADVSAAGDIGYTTGTYQMTMNDAAGSPSTERGKYVTIWKKQTGGEWKVTDDIFNADSTPGPPVTEHSAVPAAS